MAIPRGEGAAPVDRKMGAAAAAFKPAWLALFERGGEDHAVSDRGYSIRRALNKKRSPPGGGGERETPLSGP